MMVLRPLKPRRVVLGGGGVRRSENGADAAGSSPAWLGHTGRCPGIAGEAVLQCVIKVRDTGGDSQELRNGAQ